VIDLDKAVLGKENPYWRKWIQHPVNDAYWEQANFLDRLKDVNIPVFHQSGWFDGDGIGSKLNYLRMKESGHPNQKLVLAPGDIPTPPCGASANTISGRRPSSTSSATTCAGSITGSRESTTGS